MMNAEDLAALRAGREFFARERLYATNLEHLWLGVAPWPGSFWVGPIWWETDEL